MGCTVGEWRLWPSGPGFIEVRVGAHSLHQLATHPARSCRLWRCPHPCSHRSLSPSLSLPCVFNAGSVSFGFFLWMTQVPRVQNCVPISTFAEKLNTQLHLDLALLRIIMRFPSDHLRSYDRLRMKLSLW
jgi:hypothetical protein